MTLQSCNLCMHFKSIYFIFYANAKIYNSLHTVRIVRITYDRPVPVIPTAISVCSFSCTVFAIASAHSLEYTPYFCIISSSTPIRFWYSFRYVDIASRKNCGCTFCICDCGCNHTRCATFHRRNCCMCINQFFNDTVFFFFCSHTLHLQIELLPLS